MRAGTTTAQPIPWLMFIYVIISLNVFCEKFHFEVKVKYWKRKTSQLDFLHFFLHFLSFSREQELLKRLLLVLIAIYQCTLVQHHFLAPLQHTVQSGKIL